MLIQSENLALLNQVYYAVQIGSSEHVDWVEKSTDETTITWKFKFNPHEIDEYERLLFQLRLKYPEESDAKLEKMIYAIDLLLNVKLNSIIIGIHGSKVMSIGFVRWSTITTNSVMVGVQWFNMGDFKNILLNLPNTHFLQRIDTKLVLKLLQELPAESIDKFSLLPDVSKSFKVKEPTKNYGIKGFKIIIEEDQIMHRLRPWFEIEEQTDPGLNKIDKGGTIKLFYGTNRNLINSSNSVKYGKQISSLQFGFCNVQIPRDHVQGELERPGRILLIELPENEKKHIVLKSIMPKSKSDFINYFRSDLKNSTDGSCLLFVHGYNNTFEDAALRCAQLAWDLPFDGVAGFYSWPSAGKLQDYFADEAKARTSTNLFAEFLETIVSNNELKRLHIVAHSMGSLVLTLSLEQLRNRPNIHSLLTKINQLVLAAADIDQGEFGATIHAGFQSLGARRTVYASDNDNALDISEMLRRKRPRLGQIGKTMTLYNNIDTVEVSNVPVADTHGYLFESKLLLSDLYYLIAQGLSPAQRRLRQVKFSQHSYWLFPK